MSAVELCAWHRYFWREEILASGYIGEDRIPVCRRCLIHRMPSPTPPSPAGTP